MVEFIVNIFWNNMVIANISVQYSIYGRDPPP